MRLLLLAKEEDTLLAGQRHLLFAAASRVTEHVTSPRTRTYSLAAAANQPVFALECARTLLCVGPNAVYAF